MVKYSSIHTTYNVLGRNMVAKVGFSCSALIPRGSGNMHEATNFMSRVRLPAGTLVSLLPLGAWVLS